MLGNTEVSYALPAGTNIVVGSKEDVKTKKIYVFVYNDGLAHRILEYDYVTNAITLVLAEAASAPYYLNFSPSFLITGIPDVIELDADNHLLYWSAYNDEPKKINIEKAKAYSAGDYVNGYKSPFDPNIVYKIKKPQLCAPTYVWSTDSNQLLNYLFKKIVTFRTQFGFDDKEVSSWSPISKYIMPSTTGDGQSGEDLATQNNKITVTVETGSSIVTHIRIAAKDVNEADFKIVAELNKADLNIADNTTYNFDFYNNGNYVILNVAESNKPFDCIPFQAQASENLEGRIGDGNIVEGVDPVNIDIRLPISYVPAPTPTNIQFPADSHLKEGGGYVTGIAYMEGKGNRSGAVNVVTGKSTELINDRFGTTLFVPFITDPLNTSPRVAPDMGLNYIPQVGVQIYNPPPAGMTHYQFYRSKNQVMDRSIQFCATNVLYMQQDKTSVATSAAASVYVRIEIGNITGRYKQENPNSILVYDYVAGDRIRFIANRTWSSLTPSSGSLAPAGGNWVLYSAISLPFSSTSVDTPFSFNDAEVISYDSSTGILLLKTNSTVPNNLLPGVIFEIYSPAENVIDNNQIMFETGECYELVTDIHGNLVHDGTTPQLIVDLSGAAYIGSILSTNLTAGHGLSIGDPVKVVTDDYSVYGVMTVAGPIAVEVDTTGYMMVGSFNPLAAGTITRAAQFNLVGGDSFKRYQNMPFQIPGLTNIFRTYAWVDCENASNMFPSKAWSVGRPNRIDPNYKRVARSTTVYFSELFVPETNINGLSTVYDTSFQSYDLKHGSIQLLKFKDIGLVMFQELKTSMIPAGRIIYEDLTLDDTVGASRVVMSPQTSPYAGRWGISKNPESHASVGNVDYFTDLNNGVALRLSTDGLTPISDTEDMHNYFSDKCKAILETGESPHIYGVYDAKFGEYIVAFEEVTRPEPLAPIPAETLAFNEKKNQWSTYYPFAPEGMCTANTGIITFKNGALYTHNDNPLHGNFYGVQHKAEFWVYLNANPSNVKVFTAISQETLSPWEVYEITTPGGQLSNLLESDFDGTEGNQYAGVLKDVNTPNIALPLLEGDEVRDRTFLVKFRYNGTDYNKINAVNFYYIASNLSNRN
ncbi:MAG: hypothetical protein V4721_10650, partial [Bacteroidota bacterium]